MSRNTNSDKLLSLQIFVGSQGMCFACIILNNFVRIF